MNRVFWLAAAFSLVTASASLSDIIFTSAPDQLVVDPLCNSSGAELSEALESFRLNDESGCFDHLKAAYSKQPDLPTPWLMLANMYLSSGQTGRGRLLLERAVADSPTDPGVYLVCGNLALKEGRLADAGVHFEKALGLRAPAAWPETRTESLERQLNSGLATIAERREDWRSARLHLLSWLDHDPSNSSARQRLARALIALNKTDEAAKQVKLAVGADPRIGPEGVCLGWIYNQRGDLARAEQSFRAALAAASDSTVAKTSFATWLLQQDRPEEARTLAETAAKVREDSEDAKREPRSSADSTRELDYLRGLIDRHLHDYDSAATHFEAILAIAPDDFPAANQLALVLIDQEKEDAHQKALALAERNYQREPKSPEAMSTLGWVYYRLGKLEAAERCLQASVSAGGGDLSADTAYYLARLMAERGMPAEARSLLTRAIAAPGRFTYRKEAKERLAELPESPR